jgi:hypothetical protein
MSLSFLYNIEPIGLNTGYIESLSNYLARVSYLHNMSSGILISKIFTPIMSKKYLSNIAIKGEMDFMIHLPIKAC